MREPRATPCAFRKRSRAAERGTGDDDASRAGAIGDSVAMRIAACQNAAERAQAALVTLMEHSGADAGYFYSVRAGRPHCAAAIPPESAIPPAVDAFVEQYVRERADDAEETKSLFEGETVMEDAADPPSIATQAGIMFPVALTSYRDGEPIVAAVAVLRLGTGSKPPNPSLVEAIARALVVHGDVDGASARD